MEIEVDVRDTIIEEMKSQGRKLTWLAETLGINYHTLYSTLVQKTITLSDEIKDKISVALGVDF